MTDHALSGQESAESGDERRTEWEGDERCGWCRSLNNVFNGFIHDVADESWTGYNALCRECFIKAATANDEAGAGR